MKFGWVRIEAWCNESKVAEIASIDTIEYTYKIYKLLFKKIENMTATESSTRKGDSLDSFWIYNREKSEKMIWRRIVSV